MNEMASCMERSCSLEADIYSASQKISAFFWSPKVRYNSSPTVPILSQINQVHALCLFLKDQF
jgi:hypothetical protein